MLTDNNFLLMLGTRDLHIGRRTGRVDNCLVYLTSAPGEALTVLTIQVISGVV